MSDQPQHSDQPPRGENQGRHRDERREDSREENHEREQDHRGEQRDAKPGEQQDTEQDAERDTAQDEAHRAEREGAPRLGPEDSTADEQALRRLMQEVVRDIEPAPASLDRLRAAVPARRRRRQAMLGAVVTVAVLGAMLPLMARHGVVPGLSDGRSAATVSSGENPGAPDGFAPNGGEYSAKPSPGSSTDLPQDTGRTPPSADASRTSGGEGSDPTGRPNETLGGVSPSCSRDQLTDGGASAGTPDAAGRIYGSFRVANASDSSCTVTDPGLVDATAHGKNGGSGVTVLDHTEGDAAEGLPSPAKQHDKLILKPGEAYEIRFAWVPKDGDGTTSCKKAPAASSGGTNGTTGTDGTQEVPAGGDGTGTGGASGGSDGATGGESTVTTGPTSVMVVQYTPGAGAPRTAWITLSDVCPGTVYRTGMLPATR